MAIHFRKSLTPVPGAHLNFGLKSAGVSLGGRGPTNSIGTDGNRLTVSSLIRLATIGCAACAVLAILLVVQARNQTMEAPPREVIPPRLETPKHKSKGDKINSTVSPKVEEAPRSGSAPTNPLERKDEQLPPSHVPGLPKAITEGPIRGVGGPFIDVPSSVGLADEPGQPRARVPTASIPQMRDPSDSARLPAEGPVLPTQAEKLDLTESANAACVQQKLIDLGYLAGTTNGWWDARSRQALRKFRSANNLGFDDTWDEITQRALLESQSKPRAANPAFVGSWAYSPGECKEVLKISVSRAESGGGLCKFRKINTDLEGR